MTNPGKKAYGIGYGEEVSPTLMTGGGQDRSSHSVLYRQLSFGYFRRSEVASTMLAHNAKQPTDTLVIPYTLKIRGGCAGGG